MQKQVTKIPAKISKTTRAPINANVKRRVAAYARVSTDNEEQLTSYDAQVDYYTNYIKGRDDWEFVKVYADEGISGCNTKKRLGFQEMIKDALSGKIDLILTKSVSRFARNTVDSLTNIRNLKDHNVEVYFEKENIYTFDGKGELLLTIMASISQEEARSISENVTWGHRKRMADGRVSLAYCAFLGYDKDENGNLVINKEEAKTIRLIYKLFLSGMSFHTIARELEKRSIKTPHHKDKWYGNTIESILTNEKYKGDALLQKYYTKDFLSKKQIKNDGVVPQYYVKDNHEAIINKEIFEMVQNEIEKRCKGDMRYSGVGLFSSKIKCGECGSFYGSKVWHSTDKYKRIIYRCNHKYENDKTCKTPHITEDEIKEITVKAINKIVNDKKEIIDNIKLIINTLNITSDLEDKKLTLENEMNNIVELTESYVQKNTKIAQNQEEYNKKYNKLLTKYDEKKKEYDDIVDKINKIVARKEMLTKYIKDLKETNLVKEFNETLFVTFIDFITIYTKDDIRVTFKDGIEVRI